MRIEKPVIIIGAGGHAKVLIDLLKCLNIDILGAVDQHVDKQTGCFMGIPMLGGDTIVASFNPKDVYLIDGIGSVTSLEKRKRIFCSFKQKGYYYPPIIHPSAILSKTAVIKEGAQIMAGVVIQADCVVGENTILNTRVTLDHDCIVGDHVHIASGAVLSGGVTIDNEVHVGTGAVIIQEVRVGTGALIAAGSVVVNNVLPNQRVMGVPAKEA